MRCAGLAVGLGGIAAAVGMLMLIAHVAVPRSAGEHVETEEVVLERPLALTPSAAVLEAHWLFHVSTRVVDSLDDGREVSATIRFVGSSAECLASAPRYWQQLRTDDGDGTARSELDQVLCVPACGTLPPGQASARVFNQPPRYTAFQDEFDRASRQLAPSLDVSTWSWPCDGKSSTIVAVASAALACDADDCAERQRVSAATSIEYFKEGTVPQAALFPAQATNGSQVVGVLVLAAGPHQDEPIDVFNRP